MTSWTRRVAPTPLATMVVTCAMLVLSTGGHAQPASRAEWPGLWGPSRAAEATVDAGALPVVNGKELWRRPATGGYSEVVASGDLVITTLLRDGVDYVVALDALTGRDRWATSIGSTYKGHDGSDDGAIATPAVDGAEVFAVGPHGLLLALDATSGRERWRHDLVSEFGALVPRWGFAASPLVEGQLVLVPTGGPRSRGLLAFDRASGRLAWSAPQARSAAYSSAVAATLAGTRQVLVAAGDRVFAASPADGRELWSIAGPGADQEVANSPLVLPDDRVLLTFWTEALLVKVSSVDGAFVAKELWRSPRLRTSNGPTIYRDGFLYGFAGPQLICMDASTAEISWRERTGEGTLIGFGAHLLLLGRTTGDLHVLRAAPKAFSEVSRTRVFTPEVMSATGPSYAGGRLYLRNIKEIVAFNLAGN